MSDRRDHLDTFGFVVLRGYLDASAISFEFDQAMADGFSDPTHSNVGAIGNRFRYLPMMCERTPVSTTLVCEFAELASELLDSPVLPGRAKSTAYLGSANWHRDSTLAVRSIGVVCYLEPLRAETGALRVLPGSHHRDFGDALERHSSQHNTIEGVALETEPGDVIVFDERLFHASRGGSWRRQWRVDFITDGACDAGNADAADNILRGYYSGQFSPGWDAGYDVDAYPSYGCHWQTLNQRWNERLTELGAYAAAEDEEAYVRKVR